MPMRRQPAAPRGSVLTAPPEHSVEKLTAQVRELSQQFAEEQREKAELSEELRRVNQQLAAITIEHEKELHELKRAHAEEVMIREVQLEEGLVEEYEKRFKEIYQQCKTRQAEVLAQVDEQAIAQSSEVHALTTAIQQEREGRQRLVAEHDERLANFRAEIEREKSKTRADAMSQAEETLKHYQRLAQETVEKARLERQRLQVESLNANHLAETACQSFEEEVQMRTRDIIDEYRRIARKAQEDTAKEREEMRTRAAELERAVERYQQEVEDRVDAEVERRIGAHKHQVERLNDQIQTERRHFERLMLDMLRQVETECRGFEAETKKKAMEVIDSHRQYAEEVQHTVDSEREASMLRELRWITKIQQQQQLDRAQRPGLKVPPQFDDTGSMRSARS